MWLSKYFVYFVIYSFMGWVYESIFCTIKGRKWENRGFLYGPVCPIYGVGAVSITAISDALERRQMAFAWWQVFLVAFLGSIVLEYITSWALEKLFHAYWWDYSDLPLNIKGRVCFPASLGFGVAGLLVFYGVAPFTEGITSWISPTLMEFFALFFMALVAADITLTISALTNLERNVIAMEESLNRHMEQFVSTVAEKAQAAAGPWNDERLRFSKESMEEHIRNMGGIYRSALKRVKGFRIKDSGRKFYQNQMVLDYVKKYIGKKKK